MHTSSFRQARAGQDYRDDAVVGTANSGIEGSPHLLVLPGAGAAWTNEDSSIAYHTKGEISIAVVQLFSN